MSASLKTQIKRQALRWLPPALVDTLRSMRGSTYGFSGSYSSFEEAIQSLGPESGGYRAPRLLETLLQYSFFPEPKSKETLPQYGPLYTALGLISAENPDKKTIRVLDFGGGYGNYFYEVRGTYPASLKIDWTVLETAPMAEMGQKNRRHSDIRFISDFSQIIGEQFDLVLCASSLHYTPAPMEILNRLREFAGSYTLITRMPLMKDGKARVVLQKVPPYPNGLSPIYPAWVYSEKEWVKLIQEKFEVLMDFPMHFEQMPYGKESLPYRGWLLKGK